MHPIVTDLMLLFQGYQKSYGYYSGNLTEQDGGKMLGKRGSVVGDVTVELWAQHVAGKQGLGIIPINENSEVKFAAIDVDTYPLDLTKLAKQVSDAKLPLIVCRTKSGGAHLYLFLDKFYEAGQIQRKMREIASMLGYGNSEIFPKQSRILQERGDVGNWINMPYFSATDTNRYAIDDKGEKLNVYQFIEFAKARIVSPLDFLQLKLVEKQHLEGGPPCLNHLISLGFPAGTRNNGLLNLGVYAKKANPDNWEMLVDEYNRLYMDPPLSNTEVMGVIKSLQKKEFFYMCKQPPIAQYCNKARCRGCKFGIGGAETGMPIFGSLTKLKTVPPIWFLEIENGGRLELTTDELQSQRSFQYRCMEALNIMPILPKMEIWQEVISNLLERVTEIDIPPDSTPAEMMKQFLQEFCTARVQAKTADELLLGKPWTHNGFHYFRIRDFMEYLQRKKFEMKKSHIVMYLNEWGAKPKFWNLKGGGCNCMMVEEFKKQTEPFDVPKQQSDVPY